MFNTKLKTFLFLARLVKVFVSVLFILIFIYFDFDFIIFIILYIYPLLIFFLLCMIGGCLMCRRGCVGGVLRECREGGVCVYFSLFSAS